jgi:hypothetical protein
MSKKYSFLKINDSLCYYHTFVTVHYLKYIWHTRRFEIVYIPVFWLPLVNALTYFNAFFFKTLLVATLLSVRVHYIADFPSFTYRHFR